MSIRVITDSASDIGFERAKEMGVKVVPLSVTYDDIISYYHDEDFNLSEYYIKFEEDDFFPKTAQPSQKDYLDAYNELMKEGAKEIIVVVISSGLSGSINSAKLAKKIITKSHPDIKIHILDSLNTSYAQAFLVEDAIELIKEGKSGEEIMKILEEKVPYLKTYLYLPTLKYLRKGGRISVTKYILGTLLRKKPIVHVNDEGKNIVKETVTTEEEGLEELWKLTTKDGTRIPKKIALVHTNDEDKAFKMEKQINEKYPEIELKIVLTGPTIASHTGPGCLALISKFK